MSFRPQVIADSSGQWSSNALFFASYEEAESYVRDLAARWILVTDTRVIESAHPANWQYVNRTLKGI